MCKKCNGGTRAARSESRYMGASGARWTSPAYYGPGAGPYAGPAAADPAYGGANVVTVEPGGQAYGGYGGQGYGGQSYGGGESYGGYGGQASEVPGYDVVTVEPRR
ncbi:hypothetical protein ACFYWU_40305 [Streptomyces chrestomyceticus]|uniref:hypothetical protein n=1 Tax=Streptomyces chrestomyceticus TaxID=68185 RepID=UPI0036B6F735